MNRIASILALLLIAPAVAMASGKVEPSALFTACEPLLDAPAARLWLVEKDGARALLMTARPAASVRHLPGWMKDVVTSVRHFSGTTNAIQSVDPAIGEELGRRLMAGEDFGVAEALGPERVKRLEKILVGVGMPAEVATLMPPLILSSVLMGKVVMATFEKTEAQPDAHWARLLVTRASGLEPSDAELEKFIREIDFNKSVVRLANDAGAVTLNLISPKMIETVLAHFESLDVLKSLLESAEASVGGEEKFDLFDGNQDRLDANIDTFFEKTPAVGALAENAIETYLGVMKRTLRDYPGTLVHTEVMTVAGRRGLLRRLTAEGFAVNPLTSEDDWRAVKAVFLAR